MPNSSVVRPSGIRRFSRDRIRVSGGELWKLIRSSVAAWGDDYAQSMGAALSFYALFSVAPVLLIAVLFPTPGTQPYEPWALVCDLALCLLFLLVLPERLAPLRWGAGLYAVVLIGTFLFATPLGGNPVSMPKFAFCLAVTSPWRATR